MNQELLTTNSNIYLEILFTHIYLPKSGGNNTLQKMGKKSPKIVKLNAGFSCLISMSAAYSSSTTKSATIFSFTEIMESLRVCLTYGRKPRGGGV